MEWVSLKSIQNGLVSADIVSSAVRRPETLRGNTIIATTDQMSGIVAAHALIKNVGIRHRMAKVGIKIRNHGCIRELQATL